MTGDSHTSTIKRANRTKPKFNSPKIINFRFRRQLSRNRRAQQTSKQQKKKNVPSNSYQLSCSSLQSHKMTPKKCSCCFVFCYDDCCVCVCVLIFCLSTALRTHKYTIVHLVAHSHTCPLDVWHPSFITICAESFFCSHFATTSALKAYPIHVHGACVGVCVCVCVCVRKSSKHRNIILIPARRAAFRQSTTKNKRIHIWRLRKLSAIARQSLIGSHFFWPVLCYSKQ